MRRHFLHSLAMLALVASPLSLGCASGGKLSWFGGNSAEKVAAAKKPDLHSGLANGAGHEQVGDWDKAEEAYRELVEAHPDSWKAHHRLAIVADKQKRFDLAQRHYAEAIRINPQNSQLFNDLGFCFYLDGQLGKAESALLKAVRLESSNSRFQNNLGMILGQQGRIDEAFECFAKAGSEADAFYNVAFIYASNENEEAALECFELALESDPMHDQAKEALASFQRDIEHGDVMPVRGNLVRYQEGDDGAGSAGAAGLPDNRRAGDATRQLHARSRGLLDRHMASERTTAETQQASATGDGSARAGVFAR